jgi:hypothetical protein
MYFGLEGQNPSLICLIAMPKCVICERKKVEEDHNLHIQPLSYHIISFIITKPDLYHIFHNYQTSP